MVSQGIQQLATGSMDDAMRSFDGVLAQNPTNLVAILGKVRYLLYTQVALADISLGQDHVCTSKLQGSFAIISTRA